MICPFCGERFDAPDLRSINVGIEPEKKAAVLDGSAFLFVCPHCGKQCLAPEPVLYHDPDQKIIVAFSSTPLSGEGPEGYRCRCVSDIGSLIEKVKIFDAGLDDVAIEICKFVTTKEMNKDVRLKFFKMEGADSELIFAYPENGAMQMVSVGFNVYTDAAAIVSRNPAVSPTGLARVDLSWIEEFLT